MKGTAVIPCTILCLASMALDAGCQQSSGDAPKGTTFIGGGSYGNAPTFQIALGDLDGDGDLDAVFANMHAESEMC